MRRQLDSARHGLQRLRARGIEAREGDGRVGVRHRRLRRLPAANRLRNASRRGLPGEGLLHCCETPRSVSWR